MKFGPIILSLTLVASACGSSEAATTEATASDAIAIENCELAITYDETPTRAIAMNQHVTEILLALGLESSMVGTAYIDSTIRPDLIEAYDTVPVLAERYPNREQVIAAQPDIVIGGYGSAFGDEAAGDRSALLAMGIASYLTEGYCENYTGRNTFVQVQNDIVNLGTIFGVPDAAEALLQNMQVPLDAAASAVADAEIATVFVYDSGTEKAFTAGGNEMTSELLRLAGGQNIFDDVEDTFTEVSWEDVVARDPDAIVILNYGSDTAADKEAFLLNHPIASTLRAAESGAFVVVDLTDVVPGIRNGDTVLTLAQAIHPEAFD